VSSALLAYHWIDHFLGGWLRFRPVRARGGLVLAERGWWDLAVDSRRYRLSAPKRTILALGRLLPRPDVVFVLDAPSTVLVERKAELPAAELARQARAWRAVLPSDVLQVRLDAARPVNEIAKEASDEVERRSAARSERPRRWVELPRPGRGLPTSGAASTPPRLHLPRTSRRSARAALLAYQPCTRKGRIAWETARMVAAFGGFRLLPQGEDPTSEVADALAPYLRPEATFAVAESNERGRFVAFIVDDRGSCCCVAKIATESEGRQALAREAEALGRFAPLLPPPLSAPDVLAQGDGLLLLRAIPWRPRLQPWALPADVARALGAFFRADRRSARRDVGLSHGDCAPWNLLRTGGGWALVDWEDAHDQGTPFSDLFHYLVLAHLNLGRPSQRALLEGVRGRGLVARSIGAYAGGAALDVADAPQSLVSYLQVSDRGLDASTPAGRALLEGHGRLLQALEG
jgi:hypothetical protein